MTTEIQRTANRANAQHSTGPRTADGKRRVSRNAITHGLDCAGMLLPEEDRRAFAAYRAAMIADHQPVGAEEQDCVEQMIACRWRVHRAWRAESQNYGHQRYRLKGDHYDVGACVLHDLQQEKGLAYLDRKEAALNREYHRCSTRLLQLQDLRRKGLRHVVEEEELVEEEQGIAATEVAAAPVDSAAHQSVNEAAPVEITQDVTPEPSPDQPSPSAPTPERPVGRASLPVNPSAPIPASDSSDWAVRKTAEQSQSPGTWTPGAAITQVGSGAA